MALLIVQRYKDAPYAKAIWGSLSCGYELSRVVFAVRVRKETYRKMDHSTSNSEQLHNYTNL